MEIRKLNSIPKFLDEKYLGCMLDETMSGETMALSVINKINNKLRFLYKKNRFLTQP